MSLWTSFLSLFGGENKKGKVYIVDAASLANGNSGRLSPRNQIDILQSLSRFAAREGVTIYAVFEGRPLRDAPHGKKYREVFVHYTQKSQKLENLISNLNRKFSRCETMIITSNKQVEKDLEGTQAPIMRAETFKKALDLKGGNSGDDRRSSSNRRRRRRPKRSPGNSQQKNNERSNQADDSESKPEDGVDQYIDLIE